eukprot:368908-Hanusia_phi.AAC.1
MTAVSPPCLSALFWPWRSQCLRLPEAQVGRPAQGGGQEAARGGKEDLRIRVGCSHDLDDLEEAVENFFRPKVCLGVRVEHEGQGLAQLREKMQTGGDGEGGGGGGGLGCWRDGYGAGGGGTGMEQEEKQGRVGSRRRRDG